MTDKKPESKAGESRTSRLGADDEREEARTREDARAIKQEEAREERAETKREEAREDKAEAKRLEEAQLAKKPAARSELPPPVIKPPDPGLPGEGLELADQTKSDIRAAVDDSVVPSFHAVRGQLIRLHALEIPEAEALMHRQRTIFEARNGSAFQVANQIWDAELAAAKANTQVVGVGEDAHRIATEGRARRGTEDRSRTAGLGRSDEDLVRRGLWNPRLGPEPYEEDLDARRI